MPDTYLIDQIKRIDGRFRVLEERIRKLENESLTERTQRVRLENSLSGTEEHSDILEKQNKILLEALRILGFENISRRKKLASSLKPDNRI